MTEYRQVDPEEPLGIFNKDFQKAIEKYVNTVGIIQPHEEGQFLILQKTSGYDLITMLSAEMAYWVEKYCMSLLHDGMAKEDIQREMLAVQDTGIRQGIRRAHENKKTLPAKVEPS